MAAPPNTTSVPCTGTVTCTLCNFKILVSCGPQGHSFFIVPPNNACSSSKQINPDPTKKEVAVNVVGSIKLLDCKPNFGTEWDPVDLTIRTNQINSKASGGIKRNPVSSSPEEIDTTSRKFAKGRDDDVTSDEPERTKNSEKHKMDHSQSLDSSECSADNGRATFQGAASLVTYLAHLSQLSIDHEHESQRKAQCTEPCPKSVFLPKGKERSTLKVNHLQDLKQTNSSTVDTPDVHDPMKLRNTHGVEGKDGKSIISESEEKEMKLNSSPHKLLQQNEQGFETTHINFICEMCDRSFGSKRKLQQHVWNSHSGTFSCDVCEKRFHNRRTFKAHKESHLNIKCDLCGKTFSNRRNLIRHKKLHLGIRDHVCRFCSQTFTAKDCMIEHERIHTGEKPYICESCGRGFARATHFRLHRKKMCDKLKFRPKTHERIGNRSCLCYLCGKTCSTATTLKIHMRCVHTKEKPYECCHCSKVFNSANNRNRHVSDVHMGIKRFKCDVCDISFSQKYSLLMHLKTQVHKQRSGSFSKPCD